MQGNPLAFCKEKWYNSIRYKIKPYFFTHVTCILQGREGVKVSDCSDIKAYNYNELLGRIRALGHTQESFAKELGMSFASLNAKLNNRAHFRQSEIERICTLAKIQRNEIVKYFFTH